jgi:beta-glucosidase
MELIDNAVRLILNAKYDLGLLDPYKYCDSKELKLIFYKEFRISQYSCSIFSPTLKNNDQLLPQKKRGTIVVIGPLADAKENMVGTWSVPPPNGSIYSLIDGIKR